MPNDWKRMAQEEALLVHRWLVQNHEVRCAIEQLTGLECHKRCSAFTE